MLGTLMAGSMVSCTPPTAQYPCSPSISQKRTKLQQNLLLLLPEQQRNLPAAQQEARWLADTSYKAAAGIARINDSIWPGWAGNLLINIHLQDRGLCWHYQHDMYRELRRRPLSFFRIGCCVRQKGGLMEHNCVYIAAANGHWPDAWVLDAWIWNGRLKVSQGSDLDQDIWDDRPEITRSLSIDYPEGHLFPIEHWALVRCPNGKYDHYLNENTRRSAQYRRMYENIQRGKTEHPHSPTNY